MTVGGLVEAGKKQLGMLALQQVKLFDASDHVGKADFCQRPLLTFPRLCSSAGEAACPSGSHICTAEGHTYH
jgi:hypothetical protein